MRTESFFKLFAYDEDRDFRRAQMTSGLPKTGVAYYDNGRLHYPSPGTGMSFLKDADVLPPHSQTRSEKKDYEPGRILKTHIDVFNKVFKHPLPEAFMAQIMDPERTERLFGYVLKLPGARADNVLGFVLTDKHDRRVNSLFTGEGEQYEHIFNDMRDRVSWVDEGTDPLPDLEERLKAFEGRISAATDIIVSHGLQVVLPDFVNDAGYRYMRDKDEGRIYGLPEGDQDVLRGIKADSLEQLAAILVVRDELGMPRLNAERDHGPELS